MSQTSKDPHLTVEKISIVESVILQTYVDNKHRSYIFDVTTLCLRCHSELVSKLGGHRVACLNCGLVFFERMQAAG